MTAGRTEDRRAWPMLLMLSAGALLFRFLPARWVFQPDGVRFYDSDSYYHMRRVWMCLEHFPRVPIRDPFENHPLGGVTMWPPLHDTLIAAVILLLGGHHPSADFVDRVGAVAPAVLGALAVIPIYLIGTRLLGRREGLIASALMAIQPAHVLYSAVGRPDQHVTEILLSSALYAALLGFTSWAPEARRSRWDVWWPRLAAALAATAAVLVWMGSLLFVCIGVGFGALALLGRVRKGAPAIEPLARDFAGFLVLHVVSLAIGTGYLLAGMEVENTYVSFSWFQAHFSLVVAVAFVVCASVVVTFRGGASLAFRTLGPHVAALAIIAVMLVPTQLGGTLAITANAVRHINKTSHEVASSDSSHHLLSYNAAWLKSIQEYAPLLYPGGRFDVRWALDYVGPILFLAPLVVVWSLVRRRGAPREMRWLVPVWALGVGTMALSQVKYVYLASSLAALLLADLLGEVLSVTERLRVPDGVRSLATGAVALAMLAPGLRYLSHFDAGYVDLPENERAALLALRQFSPDPGSFSSSEVTPAYGVMTFWDLGNYALYLSRRPVIANNNGYGFDDSIAFFLSRSEEEATSILDRRHARYAVISDLTVELASVHELITGSLAPFFRADASRRLTTEKPFESLVYTRLFFADGGTLDRAEAAPIERMRLIFEAPGPAAVRFGRVVAPTKIFEVVAGAQIRGSGFPPDTHVTLHTNITSNLGRAWTDDRSATVDATGEFHIRTPYGSAESLPVRPTSWTLTTDRGASLSITIPDDVVERGQVIDVHAE